ncbi:MAG: hypothetical protein ACTSQH_07410 [Candidatus Hodarchaeales archaeon]
MVTFFEKKLDESNLIIFQKAVVSNSTCEIVYKKVYEYIQNNNESIGSDEGTVYELVLLKRRDPNYILVSYINIRGWLYNAISINSYSEIIFSQLKSNVEVTVKMYRRSNHQTISAFHYEVLTNEKAKITWVDFILEMFKIAGVDNYDKIVEELLPDSILRKRDEIADSNKYRTRIFIRNLVVGISVLLFFLYIFNLLKNW